MKFPDLDMPPNPPDFRSCKAILAHVPHTLDFYHPRAYDPSAGFFHFLKDDGTIYDARTRHLVSSTRDLTDLSRFSWTTLIEIISLVQENPVRS
jgi:hypothetical protein